MTQRFRTASGGRIDRDRRIAFRFNGRVYEGHPGDTVASALLANGVRLAARSVKYHRPRGLVGAGAEEPNVLLQAGEGAQTVPNLRATELPLVERLDLRTVNGWPTPSFDLQAVMGLAAPLMTTGFYYKTFMRPARAWPFYEKLIRRAAGAGHAPDAPDPDRYDRLNAHCDVLVVGAGPAGLAAALAAGRAGVRVLLADEQVESGGDLLASAAHIDDAPAMDWVRAAVAELDGMSNVTRLARATVFGRYHHGFHGIHQWLDGRVRSRLWRVRAARVVLAGGAIERVIAFGNNDRPGVLTASAAAHYARRFGVRPGERAVVFGNNDSLYGAAAALHDTGTTVAAIVDVRAQKAAVAEIAESRGIEVVNGAAVARAEGRRAVRAAVVVDRFDPGATRTIKADCIAVSGGWNPVLHLASHNALAPPVYDADLATFLPGPGEDDLQAAGAAAGAMSLDACLAEGYRAGAAAAGVPQADAPTAHAVTRADPGPGALEPFWESPQAGRPAKAFVDFQNDVAAADLRRALAEGYSAIEHVKRYSVLGFGTDQGRLGNIVGAGIVADALGEEVGEIGTTTFRPPYTPVTFGALAGLDQRHLLDPVRTTPMHDWHVRHGAVFEDVGQWKRARYYPRPGEDMDAAVRRECLATHRSVGVLDYSTLGKIDIKGPDAATLLNRVYTNGWSKLEVGRGRYGLMLDENGMVFDDGLTVRLGDEHYLMHTTTGGAARVLGWLERWLQTEWPDLDVYLTSVTDHWSTVSIAGPKSRELLAGLCDDIDLAGDAFPFMTCRHGTVAHVPARVMRVSFSGELCYEITVPSDCGLHLWEAVMAAGERFDATPYGTEAMHVLRAEKGFIIAGQDTDGSITPIDLGMERMVSRRKDFIGRRSLARPEQQRLDRKQFVGLVPDDPERVIPEGAQIVAEADPKPPAAMQGYVTSSYFGARIGHAFALGLVERGRERHGERVFAWDVDAGVIPARITSTVFFDPKGDRQNV